jgi:hypothetical protein
VLNRQGNISASSQPRNALTPRRQDSDQWEEVRSLAHEPAEAALRTHLDVRWGGPFHPSNYLSISQCCMDEPFAEIVQCGEPIPLGNSTTFAPLIARAARVEPILDVFDGLSGLASRCAILARLVQGYSWRRPMPTLRNLAGLRTRRCLVTDVCRCFTDA